MMRNQYFPKLFSPAELSGVKLKNRLVMLPMGTAYAGFNGEVTGRTIDHFVERAKGGVGLIEVGNVSVKGKIAVNQLILDSDWLLAGHYELVEAVHVCGAKIAIQITHPGRQMSANILEGRQSVSSSALSTRHYLGEVWPPARALEENEIYDMMDKFVEAAVRAKKAGYDVIELHGGHGYLINQFISPYMNKRADKFGGSLENRMRFPLELIQRLRKSVGSDYPVGMRISGEEFVEGGITVEDSPPIAKMLAAAGLAYISVSAGIFESMITAQDTMRREEGWKTYIWEAVKKAVGIPIMAGGGLKTPAFCEDLLTQGKADFIGLARPLLADPYWPIKAQKGIVEDICPCISCFECLVPSAVSRPGARRCTVNAAVGREREFSEIKPAEVKKKVLIVGGGPGGMETARVAALRGHRVTLYEKASQLGGALLVAAAAPGKRNILWLRDYLVSQIEKMKVEVKLNVEVTPELLAKLKPDVVVVATGSTPVIPGIKGVDNKKVVNALEVLAGRAEIVGQQVVVVGGNAVGCETAEYLAEKGNRVVIAEMRSGRAAVDMQPIHREILLNHLKAANIPILFNREAVECTDEGVLTQDRSTGDKHSMKADHVVLAAGLKPLNSLGLALAARRTELYSVGDCERPRIVKEAIYEGSLVGRKI